MEKVLFKCYLKYLKESNKKKWNKIWRIPIKFWVCYIVIFAFSIIPFLDSFINILSDLTAWIFVVISLLVCGICFYWSETYIVDIADESLNDYLLHCMELKVWLDKRNINSCDKIEIIVQRVNSEIDKQRTKREKVIECIIGIIKILIIPIVLAIISEYSKLEQDFVIGVARIIAILLVFAIFFVLVFLVANTINLFKINYIAKLETFISDLQGVLDLEVFVSNEKIALENAR